MGALVVITTTSALSNTSGTRRQIQWNLRPKHTSSPQSPSLPTSLHSYTHPCPPTPTFTAINPPSSLDHYSALASNLKEFVKVSDQVSAAVVGALRSGKGLRKVVEFVTEVERVGIRGVGLFDRAAMEALRRECRRVIGGFREGKEVEEFVEAMETLSGYQFQIKEMVDPVEVLKIFIGKCDPHMAVRYASIHSHSQFLYCFIIQEFGKKKDLTSAFKAFADFKKRSGDFNMFAYRSLIDACGLCGHPLKSRDIFQELLSEKVTPNIYVFNSLMNVNAHDLTYTLYMYKHMQSLGVMPDVTSYNILLKACCISKRVDMAQTIYKDIKLKESSESLKLDVITYSTMIKTFADAKMPQVALDIKEDMLFAGVTPNVITWCSLIGSCAKAGLVDKAVQVFDDMLLAGCEPNSLCCNNLLYACVQSCQYDRAFRLFNSWKVNGFRIYPRCKDGGSAYPSSSQISVTTYSPIQMTDNIFKVVPFKPTVATYNILMKACGSNYYHAKCLMEEMKNLGLSPDHVSWSTLINIFGSTQNMTAAMQAFSSMRIAGIRPDVIAYTSAIKACVECKNVKIAFSLFEEMKRHRVQPNMVTYSTLLRARRRYGSLYEVQQCLSIYQDMRKAGYRSNDYFLKELLEEWCEGVISGGLENPSSLPFGGASGKSDMNKPQSLLLEKVAAHLQKDACYGSAMDLRGLTPVEARIVVLSVLRMIKENYSSGCPIEDDIFIITGVGKDVPDTRNLELEVQQTITRVLQNELGLDVLVGPGSVPLENKTGRITKSKTENSLNTKGSLGSTETDSLARRPEDFGMLKVTRTSLYHWLQKKS